MPIEEASRTLLNRLQRFPGILCIGEQKEAGVILVYLSKKRPLTIKAIPESWEGYPVRWEYVGQVKPL